MSTAQGFRAKNRNTHEAGGVDRYSFSQRIGGGEPIVHTDTSIASHDEKIPSRGIRQQGLRGLVLLFLDYRLRDSTACPPKIHDFADLFLTSQATVGDQTKIIQ